MCGISKSVRSVHDVDGGVLLDWKRGQMFYVNPIGSRILNLFNVGFNEAEMADTISQEFGADPGLAKEHIHAFLDQLRRHGVIEAE